MSQSINNELINSVLLWNLSKIFLYNQGHQRSNCTIQWKYQGSTIRGCSHDPTPSASDKKCQEFIKKTKFEWPDNVDEVALVDESSNKLETTCYRENPGR